MLPPHPGIISLYDIAVKNPSRLVKCRLTALSSAARQTYYRPKTASWPGPLQRVVSLLIPNFAPCAKAIRSD